MLDASDPTALWPVLVPGVALALLLGIAVAGSLRWRELSREMARKDVLATWWNTKNRALRWLTILSVVLVPIWGLLIFATLRGIWITYESLPLADEMTDFGARLHVLAYVGLVTALAALFAAPLALVRAWFLSRQTDAQETGLVTDRINTAVAALGAEKEVNRLGRNLTFAENGKEREGFEWQDVPMAVPESGIKKGEWKNIALTKPNIEVRIGGLLSLELLMRDNPEHHVPIMKILTAYIRENAGGVLPIGAPEPDADKETWGKWLQANPPKPLRLDVDICLRIIEERTVPDTPEALAYTPSLERAPLAHLDLSERHLNGFYMRNVQMQGADLRHAKMQGAELRSAHIQGAVLGYAQMQGADLRSAQLQAANFSHAEMQQTIFHAAQMQGADLRCAKMQGVDLGFAEIRGADFQFVQMQGAKLVCTDMAGVDFRVANLQGADLQYAGIDANTNLSRPLKKDFEDHFSSTSSMPGPSTFPQLDESAQKISPFGHRRSNGGLFQRPVSGSVDIHRDAMMVAARCQFAA